MALVTCPECKKEVSDQALSCPHCGYPLQLVREGTPPLVEEPSPAVEQSVEPPDVGVPTVPTIEQKKSTKTPYIVLGVILVILVAIIVLLTTSKPKSSSPAPIFKETVTTPSSSPEDAVTPYTGATFEVSYTSVLEQMSDSISSFDMPNAFETTPTISNLQDGDYGDVVAYTYNVCSGVDCTLYEAKDSGKLTQVFLTAASSEMGTDEAELFGRYAANITGGFAPSKEWDALDSALDIADSSFQEDTINLYSGSLASFTYIVDNGVAMLSVLPPDGK